MRAKTSGYSPRSKEIGPSVTLKFATYIAEWQAFRKRVHNSFLLQLSSSSTISYALRNPQGTTNIALAVYRSVEKIEPSDEATFFAADTKDKGGLSTPALAGIVGASAVISVPSRESSAVAR